MNGADSLVERRVSRRLGVTATMKRWCQRQMVRGSLVGCTAKLTPGVSQTSSVSRRSPSAAGAQRLRASKTLSRHFVLPMSFTI